MKSSIFCKLFFGLLLCGTILLNSCAEDISGPKSKILPLADSIFVPLDCPIWQKNETTRLNDSEYQAIQPWLHAVMSDPNLPLDSTSWIEIRPLSAKLIEISADHQEKVLACLVDEYGATPQRRLETSEGGLFSRWYQDNIFEPLDNSVYNQQANSLKIFVGLKPDRVSHWWFNTQGKYAKQDNCSYVVEMEVRINGNACLQVAADFYKTINSGYPDNTESGHSNWFASTNGWKTIRFKVCRI